MTGASMRDVQSVEAGERSASVGSSVLRRAVLVTVGDEILRGDIVNTNAAYLSKQATTLGFDVVLHQSVADDVETIVDVVQRAARSA
ncbi:MAG: molybdopterin-binding protein, partial [Nannocystaceae bacterium]